MALTEAMVTGLRARVMDERTGRVLPNGNIKTPEGIIINPSRHREGTRTGKLVGSGDPAPSSGDESAKQAPQESAPVAQPAVAVAAPARKRITLTFSFDALGKIPSQYESIGVGRSCIVLGMVDGLSYTPPISDENGVKAFSIDGYEGQYAFTDLDFTDINGLRSIVLLKV